MEQIPAEESDSGLDGPSDADLAEMFGGGSPLRDEDSPIDASGSLPDLETFEKTLPTKTKVLMEELFRAKLNKVQRINPKKIR